jgi:hypothetical protein
VGRTGAGSAYSGGGVRSAERAGPLARLIGRGKFLTNFIGCNAA